MSDSDRIEQNYSNRYQNVKNAVNQLSDLVQNLDRDIQYYRLLIDSHEIRHGEMFTKAMETLAVLKNNRDVMEKLLSEEERNLMKLRELAERRMQIMKLQGGINPLSDITNSVEFHK